MSPAKLIARIIPILLMMGACTFSGGSAAPTVSVPTTIVPTVITPTATVVTDCTNLYFPVISRSLWDYSSTGSAIGDYTFTSQIGNVRSDGFTMDIGYSTGVNTSQEWNCTNGDLAMMDIGGGVSGSLATFNGTNAEIETDDNTGVSLPAIITAGDRWQQSMSLDGTVRLADGREVSATGTYTATYSAVGIEQVTVPAGTFNAMRIDIAMVWDLTETVEDMEIPVSIGATQNLWYAPGIGLVKVLSTNDITLNEEIVLTHYFIP